MFGSLIDRPLDAILRGVSRSIFLTLQVAPRRTRRQLAIAYLFCRAADTIADTSLCSRSARLESLRRLQEALEPSSDAGKWQPEEQQRIVGDLAPAQSVPQERELLLRLDECFAALATLEADDRARIRRLVGTLSQGMVLDLERFPAEESGELAALETEAELDLYTYYVAGCVGAFWTELQVAHIPALKGWDLEEKSAAGIRFGKGLQLTNILRDARKDFAIGRCYFPRSRLEQEGLRLEDLRRDTETQPLGRLFRAYLQPTLEHYESGWRYTLAIPRRVPRLRLACAWPLLLGLRTLALLAESDDPYAAGSHRKISRREVRAILRRSSARVGSNRALERLYREFVPS